MRSPVLYYEHLVMLMADETSHVYTCHTLFTP